MPYHYDTPSVPGNVTATAPAKAAADPPKWRILGRAKTEFVKQAKPFANCPADIFYYAQDPFARAFAMDLYDVLRDAGWNVTLAAELKKTLGVRFLTRAPSLHADEIKSIVDNLRGAGVGTKVRVQTAIETEAVQIIVGSNLGDE